MKELSIQLLYQQWWDNIKSFCCIRSSKQIQFAGNKRIFFHKQEPVQKATENLS